MPEPPKKGEASGVRGPRGPQRQGTSGGKPPRPQPDGARNRLERLSFPVLRVISGLPRWLVVVVPAVLLLLGLVQTGSLAWLGALLLFIVWLFVAWLTALSWPAVTAQSKVLRIVILLAFLGIIVYKLIG